MLDHERNAGELGVLQVAFNHVRFVRELRRFRNKIYGVQQRVLEAVQVLTCRPARDARPGQSHGREHVRFERCLFEDARAVVEFFEGYFEVHATFGTDRPAGRKCGSLFAEPDRRRVEDHALLLGVDRAHVGGNVHVRGDGNADDRDGKNERQQHESQGQRNAQEGPGPNEFRGWRRNRHIRHIVQGRSAL